MRGVCACEYVKVRTSCTADSGVIVVACSLDKCDSTASIARLTGLPEKYQTV